MTNIVGEVKILPWDKHNKELVSSVHPQKWQNPEPEGRYNLVVIGAGTAGLVTAAAASSLGARVALIERHLMGGDCLNVGCVPSKALIRSAKSMSEVRRSASFGLKQMRPSVDFARVMERVRMLRARISPNDSAKRFKGLGVDVFIGEGRFEGPNTVKVDGKILKFKKAVIATGARAMEPPIPGLKKTGFLTNETVFNLTRLPKTLAVIGGGPIGCELGQAFAKLGSNVTLIQTEPQFLIREDPDAAAILAESFRADGIKVFLSSIVKEVSKNGTRKVLKIEKDGKINIFSADEILLATGRVPNIEGLDLEKAGVQYSNRGVGVDDNLRTTNKNIFAAGDICMAHKFTHAADFAARIVIQNSLFKGRKKLSALNVPWCTYTEPEIAHVGLYEREAQAMGIPLDTYTKDFKDVDRAILEGDDKGFVKIHVQKGTDKILGATIVCHNAGDMISEISVAMSSKVGLGSIASVIHPYPTKAEAIRQAGDLYNRTRLTPFVKKLFTKWLAWTR